MSRNVVYTFTRALLSLLLCYRQGRGVHRIGEIEERAAPPTFSQTSKMMRIMEVQLRLPSFLSFLVCPRRLGGGGY